MNYSLYEKIWLQMVKWHVSKYATHVPRPLHLNVGLAVAPGDVLLGCGRIPFLPRDGIVGHGVHLVGGTEEEPHDDALHGTGGHDVALEGHVDGHGHYHGKDELGVGRAVFAEGVLDGLQDDGDDGQQERDEAEPAYLRHHAEVGAAELDAAGLLVVEGVGEGQLRVARIGPDADDGALFNLHLAQFPDVASRGGDGLVGRVVRLLGHGLGVGREDGPRRDGRHDDDHDGDGHGAGVLAQAHVDDEQRADEGARRGRAAGREQDGDEAAHPEAAADDAFLHHRAAEEELRRPHHRNHGEEREEVGVTRHAHIAVDEAPDVLPLPREVAHETPRRDAAQGPQRGHEELAADAVDALAADHGRAGDGHQEEEEEALPRLEDGVNGVADDADDGGRMEEEHGGAQRPALAHLRHDEESRGEEVDVEHRPRHGVDDLYEQEHQEGRDDEDVAMLEHGRSADSPSAVMMWW